jgi:RNA polymerase sigma-70 factor (ECF subfamily)
MHDAELEQELEAHHRAAYGWALACCRWDPAVADDVLQNAYLKVLDGRARYAGRSAFKTWLFGVIRRTAAEERRRRLMRRVVRLGESEIAGDHRAGADARLIESEEAARLVAALQTMPQRQRELLHLVFYQDLTIAEAAGVLGIALGTARAHYQRGKRRLRALLGGRE